MTKIFSYVVPHDRGSAPNPFGGVCTLTICKPEIRRTAAVGDWVVGTGAKNAKCNDGKVHDLSDSVVYAMKVSDIKTLKQYDEYCRKELPGKLPDPKAKDWRHRVGDCIYDYSQGDNPKLRPGVHPESERITDLSGINALLSNEFYYFGEEARPLPDNLKSILKKGKDQKPGPGHKKIEDVALVERFEAWISRFEKNKIYANPQMRWKVEENGSEDCGGCSSTHSKKRGT